MFECHKIRTASQLLFHLLDFSLQLEGVAKLVFMFIPTVSISIMGVHTPYVEWENSAEKQKSRRKADEKEASEQNSTHLLHL